MTLFLNEPFNVMYVRSIRLKYDLRPHQFVSLHIKGFFYIMFYNFYKKLQIFIKLKKCFKIFGEKFKSLYFNLHLPITFVGDMLTI